MNKKEAKRKLIQSLVDCGCMWSYDVTTHEASDSLIIEKSLLHLEFEDMHQVFDVYGYQKVRRIWKERLLPQGEYLSIINWLLASLFFHVKNPNRYLAKYGCKFKGSIPILHQKIEHNNLVEPSLQDLLGMKLFTISVRYAFRDYYDIYSLLQKECSLTEGIMYACKFSQHRVKSKLLYSTLLMPELFSVDEKAGLLSPKYAVSSNDIAEYIKTKIS